MTRIVAAVGVVVAIVVAGVALSTSSPPSRVRVRVVGRGPATVPASPELTTTTVPVTTTTVPPVAQPPTTAPQPASPPSAPGTYTVQAGDTLAAIAAAHGLDWPGVCYANRLADCNRIYPGQVLALKSEQPPAPPTGSDKPGKTFNGNVTPQPAAQPKAAGSICDTAIPYLQTHAAPGYTFTCAPGASEGPCASIEAHAVGCTVGGGPGQGGAIYIDSNCHSLTPAMNEASNSRLFAGLSTAPVDPYGPAAC